MAQQNYQQNRPQQNRPQQTTAPGTPATKPESERDSLTKAEQDRIVAALELGKRQEEVDPTKEEQEVLDRGREAAAKGDVKTLTEFLDAESKSTEDTFKNLLINSIIS